MMSVAVSRRCCVVSGKEGRREGGRANKERTTTTDAQPSGCPTCSPAPLRCLSVREYETRNRERVGIVGGCMRVNERLLMPIQHARRIREPGRSVSNKARLRPSKPRLARRPQRTCQAHSTRACACRAQPTGASGTSSAPPSTPAIVARCAGKASKQAGVV